eukprot:SAG31_NODE_657_length_13108_cov_3.079330_9_plen_89_part_00
MIRHRRCTTPQIEQIAVEDNPVYTAFNERDMCRLLSIIPSILLHVADVKQAIPPFETQLSASLSVPESAASTVYVPLTVLPCHRLRRS